MENNAERTITISQNSWLRWTLANFAALIVAILAVLPVAVNLAYAGQPPWLRGAVGGATLGLALGAAQWWVLRPSFSLSPRWIFISMIGGAIGLASGMQVADFLPATLVNDPIQRDSATVFAAATALGVAISGLLFGLALGLAQWWLLRPQVTGAAWWIVANASGWAAGLGLAALFADHPLGWLISAGLINGVITGWLLQHWANNGNRARGKD